MTYLCYHVTYVVWYHFILVIPQQPHVMFGAPEISTFNRLIQSISSTSEKVSFHLCPIQANDDVCRVGPVDKRCIVVLVVDQNIQRGFHSGDARFRSHSAHQQQPVTLHLLAVQRCGHHQLCGVLVYSKRPWSLCGENAATKYTSNNPY